MDTGTLNGIIIILLIVAFIGLTIWLTRKAAGRSSTKRPDCPSPMTPS